MQNFLVAAIEADMLSMKLSKLSDWFISSSIEILLLFLQVLHRLRNVHIAFLRCYVKTCEQAGKSKSHIIFEHSIRKHSIAMYLNSKNPNAYGNKDNGFCNFKYKTSGLHAVSFILAKM